MNKQGTIIQFFMIILITLTKLSTRIKVVIKFQREKKLNILLIFTHIFLLIFNTTSSMPCRYKKS